MDRPKYGRVVSEHARDPLGGIDVDTLIVRDQQEFVALGPSTTMTAATDAIATSWLRSKRQPSRPSGGALDCGVFGVSID
jgi:hypothetical protein